MQIRNYICTDHTVLSETTPLSDLLQQILNSSFPHFMITNKDDGLVGILILRDLRAFFNSSAPFDSSMAAADIMIRDMVTVTENENLEKAFHLFSNHHFSFLPVVSLSQPSKVIGCLKKDDLMTAYNQQILKDHCPPTTS